MSRLTAIASLSIVVASGCASKPTEIQPQYVSPLQYQSYDCDQVSGELGRISRKTTQLFSQLDKAASNDQAQMAIGLVLFWPTLFLLEGGDGPEAAEYARLKGEFDALEQAAIQKKCDTAQFVAIREQEAKAIEDAKKKQEDECDPTLAYSDPRSCK